MWLLTPRAQEPQAGTAQVTVVVPPLTAEETAGQDLFNANCAACHGPNGIGTDKGPPFLSRIYEPKHHGDMAFVIAAHQGVRAHHWQFGNMPPVQGVTDQDVLKIVTYIRALQRANGIQ
ncbi:cytochrome c [Defluviimonas sp. WL0075]|uniref:Cytochrome c n=1 Tax=Albidovulum sediminicola TaxID=2984331 RepID=A0ABT2Z658_9RHOB|nr:cytochrome c [Defluviimonas sp. WL0075]